MVWTKLFRYNLEESLKAKKVGLYTRPSAISGREKLKVIKLFDQLNVPFIYCYKTYLRRFNNLKSPYHRLPNGLAKKEKIYYEKLKRVRAALASMSERELKIKQELLNKRKMGGINDVLKKIYPFVLKPTRESSRDSSLEMSGGKRRKMISEHVVGVPKLNIHVSRKDKEKIKYHADQGLVGYDVLVKEQQKFREKNKITRRKSFLEKNDADDATKKILSGKLNIDDLRLKNKEKDEINPEKQAKGDEKVAEVKSDKNQASQGKNQKDKGKKNKV
jgi:hypothetical protein